MNEGFPCQKLLALRCVFISICALFVLGCGTTKWSDTSRTGTEQLLISNAIDRVAAKIDFSPMRDRKCYLNTLAITKTTDHDYLAMTIRQHLATAGAILVANEADADYIVDIRAGAVGTDRDDVLVGIPATTLPSIPSAEFTGTTIPEIPFIKRTRQRGVAKIALFAYNKTTGQPVWSSGNNQGESTARNLWFLGAGPLTSGTIYRETTFAGDPLPLPIQSSSEFVVEQSQVFSETSRTPSVPPSRVPVAVPNNLFPSVLYTPPSSDAQNLY